MNRRRGRFARSTEEAGAARAPAAPLGKEGVEIAYFDEGCDWSSFIDEALARRQEPLGLHVSLASDVTVRIFCDEARLETGSD